MPDDKRFMSMALALARRGSGKTSPNPMVGAVIVKGGRIVGSGWHKKAGLPHAEIIALNAAGKKAKGATLYVNLEPCGHFGRTPPCADAIIKSGVKKVVAAMKDPNPLTSGRGFGKLKKVGIKVISGVLKEEAEKLNEVFIKYITKKEPFVIVKVAQGIDGKIATRTGDSKWISSEESRRYVHKLRSQVDAVMIGANTVIKDDPLLTSRLLKKSTVPATKTSAGKHGPWFMVKKIKQPIKIVVDSELKISLGAKIFSSESPAKTIIVSTTKAPRARVGRFERAGAKVLVLGGKDGKVSLRRLMRELGKREIASVLVEGGGELIGSLVDERLVDKFLFFLAPKIIGGRDAITSVEGEGAQIIKDAVVLKKIEVRKIGGDLLIEGYC